MEPLNLAGSLAGPAQCHLPRQPWGLRAAFKHPSTTAPTAPCLGRADSAASRVAFLSLQWQGCCQLQRDESQTGEVGEPSANSPVPPGLGALSRPRKELPVSPRTFLQDGAVSWAVLVAVCGVCVHVGGICVRCAVCVCGVVCPASVYPTQGHHLGRHTGRMKGSLPRCSSRPLSRRMMNARFFLRHTWTSGTQR